ncbi:formyltransferase family protein [Pedobacter nyackensis]|uniref:formyltransferase family protein n=1 Tax=Pedobacter nyackensis TaxID=475255 RepID=UPI0029308846|nr:formyltransferase family protein [Pedobacter nyackensis]
MNKQIIDHRESAGQTTNLRVGILCNSDLLVLPSILHLKQRGILAGVAVPHKSKRFLDQRLLHLGLTPEEITYISKDQQEETLLNWIDKAKATTVLVFAFPWKLSISVLNKPANRFYNFHFGLLPKYRGSDPIFWQLKNGEAEAGLVVHEMTEDIDGGPIAWTVQSPVIYGENYGMYCARMGVVAMSSLDGFLKVLLKGKFDKVPQEQLPVMFNRKPVLSDLTINWELQNVEEIECLVNACNPKYGGAFAILGNMEIRLLEVVAVELNTNGQVDVPGTIVYADVLYGLIVACIENRFLKINVARVNEGFVSGSKLFGMGITTGMRFQSEVFG